MTMSRYIDADAYAAEMKTRQDACLELMNAAREMDNEKMYGQKSAAFSVFVEAKLTLDAMPTVDAVPVVRCGKCKYFVKNTWECVRIADRFGDEYSDATVYPEYFCADGERRTE